MVTAKAFDYSLFRAAKEMLYLPLSFRAKTVGKTMVDMNTYRAAKAAASVLLLLLIPVGKGAVLGVAAGLAVLWFILTVILVPRYLQARDSADPAGD
jgi:ATP/ADP translocase